MYRYLFMINIALAACNSKSATPGKPAAPSMLTDSIKPLITHQLTQVAAYPSITDTAQLLTDFKLQLGIDLREAPEQRDGRFTAFKKFPLYGSKDSLYLLEYTWGNGAMASYPWKCQFIFSKDGRLIKRAMGERYALERVFPQRLPYLLVTQVTARGNGGHCYYRMNADTLEDVFDGFDDDEYYFKTIDGHEDTDVLEPNELPATYHDVNGDGYNDIVFSGKKLMLGGYTKDGGWYDAVSVDGKTTTFTPEHPASVIPIRFVFLYNPATQHFTWKRPSKQQQQTYSGH